MGTLFTSEVAGRREGPHVLRKQRLTAVIALTLLLGTALAGCMGGDDGGGPGDGDGSGDLTSEESRTEVVTAFSTLENSTIEFGSKLSVNTTFVNKSGEQTQRGWMEFYFDGPNDEAISRFAGEAIESGGSGGGSGGSLTVARMGKTGLFGADKQALSTYNDSAQPVDNLSSLGNLEVGGQSGASPLFIFDAIRHNITPAVSEFTAKETTYEGKDALEIESKTDPGGSDPYLRVVLWLEPKRPALVESKVTSEAAEGTSLQGAGELTMTFQYGEDASNAIRKPLVRVETMTYQSAEDASGAFQGNQGRWTNHTIQPSRDIPAGEVALSEINGIVKNSSSRGQEEIVITMSLDEGSAESDEARLTYEDVDGNSMVSEGDVIRIEQLDENASLGLTLEDTETGWKVVPSAGALAALAAAGAAAALTRRRP
jgi:hypothetical protein